MMKPRHTIHTAHQTHTQNRRFGWQMPTAALSGGQSSQLNRRFFYLFDSIFRVGYYPSIGNWQAHWRYFWMRKKLNFLRIGSRSMSFKSRKSANPSLHTIEFNQISSPEKKDDTGLRWQFSGSTTSPPGGHSVQKETTLLKKARLKPARRRRY